MTLSWLCIYSLNLSDLIEKLVWMLADFSFNDCHRSGISMKCSIDTNGTLSNVANVPKHS